jgi:hypothetical protein
MSAPVHESLPSSVAEGQGKPAVSKVVPPTVINDLPSVEGKTSSSAERDTLLSAEENIQLEKATPNVEDILSQDYSSDPGASTPAESAYDTVSILYSGYRPMHFCPPYYKLT